MIHIYGFSHDLLSVYALPYLIIAVLMLLLGIFVFYHNRKSLTNLSYLAICTSVFVWLTVNYLGISALDLKTAQFWSKFVYIGITLIPPSMYFFAIAWLGLFEQKKKYVFMNYAIGFIFIFLFLMTDQFVVGSYHHFFGYFSKLSPLAGIYLLYFFVVAAAFFWTLFQGYRQEVNASKKRHIRHVLIAFLIAFVGSADFLASYGVNVYPISFLTVSFFVFIIARAIIFYKLMDIETVIHKTIMWLSTSIILGAPLLVFFYFSREWLCVLPPPVFLVVVAGVFFVFALYTRYIQPQIDHVFQRRMWDLMNVLERFTDDLVHLKDLEDVALHILNTIKNVFYVSHVSMAVRQGNSDHFQKVASSGDTQGRALDINDPFLSWLAKYDRVVIKDYITLDPELTPIADAAMQYLDEEGARICVPMIVNQRLLGVLHIGEKLNLKPFRTAEIMFLRDFRRSASIALSNSLRMIEMQENLRKWNEELEEKVKLRTKELEETQAQLIQAEKMATIGTLAGGVAHEINNPLTAVLTNAQILKMTANAEDAECIDLIESGAKRCQAIIQKLMKYCRKSDEADVTERVFLNAVVRNVVNFLKYQFEQENVTVVTELATDQVEIDGNSNEVEQILTNLLLNAKDATRHLQGEGRIAVRTFACGAEVGFEVADNGVGIPESNLTKIFDPFFTTKDVGKGTGLGLAVTHGIIQKLGGRVNVTSEVGTGSKFTVVFPKS